MNIMRCPSTFSMHTFLWREYSRYQDDASLDGTVAGNVHRGTNEPLLKREIWIWSCGREHFIVLVNLAKLA
ncbi:hypothetical protein OESDEN_24224 [Oesophagostomum dentatum]|uniref:Uncharacterized protein n=1 Tax=Oesophagostomum dentatum TaxID=61180 RepID=A0A0B1RY90_OESDE|nr:hypothetical protein OESDEN_24224 [Oesophagostomum dentatum]